MIPGPCPLPFRGAGGSNEDAHLGEGIAEEILLALGRQDGLRVLSRTSSFRLAEAGFSPAEVGRRLQADAVLGGSLLRKGTRLVVEAELLRMPAGERLWAERHDHEHEEVFHLVEEIAGRVARSLGMVLDPLPPRPPVDLAAYDAYLKGRQAYFRYNRHAMGEAAEAFRAALGMDPSYAAAWAGLANVAAFEYIYVERSQAKREAALDASARALELDPGLAEAYAARGVALSAAGEVEAAEIAFETALRLDPDLYEAAYFYARHCVATGRPEQAILFFEQAASLRPEDCQPVLLVAQVYGSLGIEDEARAARLRGLSLAEEQLVHAPQDARTRYLGANALVALGECEKGLAWARMARALDPEDSMLLYNLGCIHALAQDAETALDCLEQATAACLTQKAWFLHDGDLEVLRSHPRFQALLERLG